MRSWVGRFGITGKAQTSPMSQLSDGLRSRVVFSWLALKTPHMLLLDEPTNHLDIETIDSLAKAINGELGATLLLPCCVKARIAAHSSQCLSVGTCQQGSLFVAGVSANGRPKLSQSCSWLSRAVPETRLLVQAVLLWSSLCGSCMLLSMGTTYTHHLCCWA